MVTGKRNRGKTHVRSKAVWGSRVAADRGRRQRRRPVTGSKMAR